MSIEKFEEKFTRYEVARILGARSLQLAMDAPVLLKLTKEQEEEELNFDSLKTAEKELEAGVLPITVKRPFPKKSEKQVKKLSEEEIKEKLEKQAEKEAKEIAKEEEEKDIESEEKEEKEIEEEGEIMELANPEDEFIEEDKKSEDEEEF